MTTKKQFPADAEGAGRKVSDSKTAVCVGVFFGEKLADAMADGDLETARNLHHYGDGIFCERRFDTAAERDAYIRGLNDMWGWNGFYVLDEHEKKPDWAVDKSSE